MKQKKSQVLKPLCGSIRLNALLQPWIHQADIIYLNTNENDRKACSRFQQGITVLQKK